MPVRRNRTTRPLALGLGPVRRNRTTRPLALGLGRTTRPLALGLGPVRRNRTTRPLALGLGPEPHGAGPVAKLGPGTDAKPAYTATAVGSRRPVLRRVD
jgi:hypothetical protein